MTAPTLNLYHTLSNYGDCMTRGNATWANTDNYADEAVVDLSALTGLVNTPKGIKIKKIDMQMATYLKATFEFNGILADTFVDAFENRADIVAQIVRDYTQNKDGGLKWAANEVADDCGTSWTGAANVTQADETTIVVVSGTSQKFTVAAAFTTGNIATYDFGGAGTNIAGYDAVSFYIYSSIALQPRDLGYMLDNTSACSSPLENITIDRAIAAGVWTKVELDLTVPTTLTSIVSHGLYANRDFGAGIIYIDDVRLVKKNANRIGGAMGDLVLTTANAESGSTIDFQITWKPVY
jgi:hypothetical protein